FQVIEFNLKANKNGKDIKIREPEPENLILAQLNRFNPSECILQEKDYNDAELLKILKQEKKLNVYCFFEFREWSRNAYSEIKKHFRVKTLRSFGLENKRSAQKAAAALIGYFKYTQKEKLAHLRNLKVYRDFDHLILDPSTVENLELFYTLREGNREGSFFDVLDHTLTASGGRILKSWLKKPLCDKKKISKRLDAVDQGIKKFEEREKIREILKNVLDISRILGRLSLGVGRAGDLNSLKDALDKCFLIKIELADFKFEVYQEIEQAIDEKLKKVINLVDSNIVEDPPLDLKNGGLIKNGVHSKLDRLRDQVRGNKDWILSLEQEEKKKTKISSLKIKFNKIFGYYIEISRANLHLAPRNYIRKQTMVNAERFITPELKKYEERILSSEEEINKIEYDLFLELVGEILLYSRELQNLAKKVGELDCFLAFADLAEKENYSKPKINELNKIGIVEGRHPVVDKLIKEEYVANDVKLNDKDHQLLVITGPNMAGKSVLLRQAALIVLMAHLGCYVPAKKADICLVDRIFVRSGASDAISKGLSTFMVEMVETAHILRNATTKSLIIMDEIGRGTSTYDGISIAWAIAEHLVRSSKFRPKTLFATHYHELQLLEDKFLKRIKNYNLAVEEKNGEPVFLHKMIPGRAFNSYAVSVAKLAGMPDEITVRAVTILSNLEKKFRKGKEGRSDLDGDVFSTQTALFEEQFDGYSGLGDEKRKRKSLNKKGKKVLKELEKMDIYNMTPVEALNRLVELKTIVQTGGERENPH
ncbi:MAG: DNA mismatch repair protein MutS, partial [Candidatus Moranbacteria bacterium]|nr:DNA mismatch repair protein MutS [Candidatus Moranbacteria bacterium]